KGDAYRLLEDGRLSISALAAMEVAMVAKENDDCFTFEALVCQHLAYAPQVPVEVFDSRLISGQVFAGLLLNPWDGRDVWPELQRRGVVPAHPLLRCHIGIVRGLDR